MQEFKIRAYGKSELAMLYRPGALPSSALKTLNSWIRRNQGLSRELRRHGYTSMLKNFTPRQVAVIIKYLGPP